MPAVRAAYAGETLLEVTTVEILVDRFADDRPEIPVTVFVAHRIDLLEALEMLLDQAVERSFPWSSRTVNPLGALGHDAGQLHK